MEKLIAGNPHNEEAANELSGALKIHKIRNLSIQQTLFRIEAIGRRLYVIKLLISALPGSRKAEFWQYVELADALCAYVKDSFQQKNEPLGKETPVDFGQRLSALEESTLMAYIRIAKGHSPQLSARAASRFNLDLATISTVLDLERCDAKFEFDKWTSLASQALQEKQELLHAVATNRCEASAGILKMTEQSLDVLSVTISLTEARAKKTKAS